jgi:TonB family protein
MIMPSVAPRGGGGGGGGGSNSAGNPGANNRAGNSTGAQADVDFGPYMADLQRRIKKHWFPPKGNESKRVVVVFKVHSGGELSGLHLDHSSGVAIADNAALKAVEDAAPFRPLPAGAPDAVDIQFTFDYNVFTGGGSGSFRRF